MPALVALIAWVGYRAYLMFNVEYEYIVTNGELDIDRIIARRGRKRMINIKTNAYELIAPYDDGTVPPSSRASLQKRWTPLRARR